MTIPQVTWQTSTQALQVPVKKPLPSALTAQTHVDTFTASIHSEEKPQSSFNKALLPLGMSSASVQTLTKQLTTAGDKPYHAGRLWNGKTYVVTQNDKLFYGWPNALKEIPVTHATRDRCIDAQTRDYTAENGLHIRIQNKNNQRTTKASIKLFGLSIPVPHFRQTASSAWD